MLIANKYEFPDNCPDTCPRHTNHLLEDFGFPRLGDACSWCPVLVCSGEEPLIEPKDYNTFRAEKYLKYIRGTND